MNQFERSPAAKPAQEKSPETEASLEKLREMRVFRSDGTIDDDWKVIGIPEDMRKENAKIMVHKIGKDENGKNVAMTKSVNAIELYALNKNIRGTQSFKLTEWVKLWNTTEANPLLKIKMENLSEEDKSLALQPDEAKARLRELSGKVRNMHKNEIGKNTSLENYVTSLDRREKLFGLSPKEAQELRAMREAMRKTDREEKMAA